MIKKVGIVEKVGKVADADMKQLLQVAKQIKYEKNKPNNFFVLREVKHQVISFVVNIQNINEGFYVEDEKIYEQLVPILDRITHTYDYPDKCYPRIMFARLPAGKRVYAHVDGASSTKHAHKLHIPIHTNPSVIFRVENKKMHFQKGFLYEVNNRKLHSTRNSGQTPRLHLIFEIARNLKKINKHITNV